MEPWVGNGMGGESIKLESKTRKLFRNLLRFLLFVDLFSPIAGRCR